MTESQKQIYINCIKDYLILLEKNLIDLDAFIDSVEKFRDIVKKM